MRSKEKSRRTAVLCCVLAAILLVVMALSVWVWSCTAGFYSERQHLSRIEGLAKKRYLGEGSEYTGLEVYPLYDENEEFHYALIELKPQGFVYVKINENAFFSWLGGVGMYTRDVALHPWSPFRVVFENFTDASGKEFSERKEQPILDENGETIEYFQSHFAVAKIGDERRYLLGEWGIPAVKRGEQYLDLIDGELIDYDPKLDGLDGPYASSISFIPKANFDL